MLRKLTVLLMAVLFSFPVAGLSWAQTKPGDKPADKPAVAPQPPAVGDTPAVNPCAAGEKEMQKKENKKKKAIKKLAKKKYGEWKKKGEVPGPVEK